VQAGVEEVQMAVPTQLLEQAVLAKEVTQAQWQGQRRL
jgi:hypothetical protein